MEMVRFCFLALAAYRVVAVPAPSTVLQTSLNSTQSTSDATISSWSALPSGILANTTFPSAIPTAQSNVTAPLWSGYSNGTLTNTPATSRPLLGHSWPTSNTSTSPPFSTTFVTKVVTVFPETTSAARPTSTSIFTLIVTATATTTPTITPSWDNRTAWTAPPQMTDLSAFNITYFPSGQRNLHLISQIPTQDIAGAARFLQTPISSPDNVSSTLLQLVYPAHSVNPGSKPEGGADFYAAPLNLAGTRNVTLEYSVFFPADFDWVKGGKLPGLFGGHTGCSGGSSARDCFSTRLMWRQQGMGELYLYAPKDKQTTSLCEDARSVCDSSYGFSVGRGAFNFTAGFWTRLRQNVVLNTPGKNDGVFTLSVDGRMTINRTDVFYRDVVKSIKKNKLEMSASTPSVVDVAAARSDKDGGGTRPTEFLGLFFSTFFGGHGKKYATPRQQYACFKDFSIIRHD